MSLNDLSSIMLPAIEKELQQAVARLDDVHLFPFKEMLTYHMGWTGEGAGPEAQGKRIRPLLLLLVTSACGSAWQPALPAASALELIHNFSLVHDDIQDGSELRRGRPTVWKIWGMPQAINAGDALFILAQMSWLDLQKSYSDEIALNAGKMINAACLKLSSGQFLDISYEKQAISLEDYWPMVAGKTAALLSDCSEIGALLGSAEADSLQAWHDFGHYLGLAFQVQDDYLGIWGDSTSTGKSTDSDLVTGKKSLPVLYSLEKKGKFARRWMEGPIHTEEVEYMAKLLIEEGACLFTQQTADQMTDLALQNLRLAAPQGDPGEALFELAHMLLDRKA